MADDPKPEGTPTPESAPTPPPEAAPAVAPSAPAAPAAAAKPAPRPAAPKAPAVMETEPWEGELPDALKEKFGDAITGYFRYVGQSFLTAKPEAAVPILEFLKSDWGFDYLVDVTATDDPAKPERFELVYILYSFSRNERIRIKARVKEGDKPATAVPVHITADWLEREVFDMFGIEFAGHPNMTRILLPDEWQGHPLRKDYNILGMDQKWVQENLGIESGQ
ncbi:MAG: NADH-quinone oxidoreductase subunit C [Bryobacteraceae bacterium]|nr:NADH-quinone oxidoreductase subunit C [Bryobacteraceae bacterium]